MTRYLLALDTSGTRCSVALWRMPAGKPFVDEVGVDGTQGHAERLLPMVSDLLDRADLVPADIDGIAFGQGPGAFTGLRIACGVAQGMALALDVPLAAVGAHEALADSLPRDGAEQLVIVAMDARMGEVYAAAFRLPAGGTVMTEASKGLGEAGQASLVFTADPSQPAPQVLEGPLLMAAGDVPLWLAQRLPAWRKQGLPPTGRVAGDAWDAYPEALPVPDAWTKDGGLRPDARHVARLGVLALQAGAGIDPALAQPLYVRDKVAFTTAERLAGLGGNPKAASPLLAAEASRHPSGDRT